MKAKKENKVYKITTDTEKQRYLKEGYDIYDDDGTLVEYSPLKKIAYGEYAKLQEENTALKAENETLAKKVGELEEAMAKKVGELEEAMAENAEADIKTAKKVTANKAGE